MKQYGLLSYRNKLVTINYQQLLLYSERKVIIYRKLMIQLGTRCSVSSHYGIPLSVIEEKISNYLDAFSDISVSYSHQDKSFPIFRFVYKQ